MPQPPPGPGGGRKPVKVPGPLRRAGVAPAGVFGQRREQPQAAGVGAGEGLLAGVTGAGQDGAQLRADPGRCQLVPAPAGNGCSKVRPAGCRESIAPTMTWSAVTTSWPLYPAA
jgi:hypothetical protein